jgi:hypothetical protein
MKPRLSTIVLASAACLTSAAATQGYYETQIISEELRKQNVEYVQLDSRHKAHMDYSFGFTLLGTFGMTSMLMYRNQE